MVGQIQVMTDFVQADGARPVDEGGEIGCVPLERVEAQTGRWPACISITKNPFRSSTIGDVVGHQRHIGQGAGGVAAAQLVEHDIAGAPIPVRAFAGFRIETAGLDDDRHAQRHADLAGQFVGFAQFDLPQQPERHRALGGHEQGRAALPAVKRGKWLAIGAMWADVFGHP